MGVLSGVVDHVNESNHPNDAELREIAALADGSLPEGARAETEQRIASSAVLSEELRRQRGAVVAIRGANAEVRAPAGLRTQIEAQRAGARVDPSRDPAQPGSGHRWWTRWPALASAAVATCAVAFALIVLPGGDPSVDEAAELAALPATGPAPSTRQEEPTLLTASFEGLSYPDWAAEFGWQAVGERTDELDGRATRTVFYENDDGNRIGYTIVAGAAIDVPEGAKRSVIEGVEFDSFQTGNAEAVTWLRDGHTCVLSGEGVDESTLLDLAAWKGDGAVAF